MEVGPTELSGMLLSKYTLDHAVKVIGIVQHIAQVL